MTEVIDPLQTMALAWSPNRPGNWIFHCHFAGHISHLVALDTEGAWTGRTARRPRRTPRTQPHQMYGLVLGIRVAPEGTIAPLAPGSARRIRLLVRSRPNVYGVQPGYAYVLGGSPEEADPTPLPVPRADARAREGTARRRSRS